MHDMIRVWQFSFINEKYQKKIWNFNFKFVSL